MGIDFSIMKYTDYKRVINKHCTEYYQLYLDNRSKKICNNEVKRTRVIEQYAKERDSVIRG